MSEIRVSRTCYSCGQGTTSESVDYNGACICDACALNYEACVFCGVLLVSARAGIQVDDKVACLECAYREWSRCEECGEWFDPNGSDSEGMLCFSCNENYFSCEECGERYHIDDCALGDRWLCVDCSFEETPLVHPYHTSYPSLSFHGSSKETLFFGVELETDDFGDYKEASTSLHALSRDEKLFWLSLDSSLHKGIEIITQPCSLDYHRTQFPWAKITKAVADSGGKSHNTLTCGMHIHFSRSFYMGRGNHDLYQIRLIYLFEKFYDYLAIFSRRSQDALARNAKKYNNPLYNKTSGAKMREITSTYSRQQGVNIHPSDTIEIRIFRGTLKVETILASIELVDFLVRLAKTKSTKYAQNLSWGELVKRISCCDYKYLMPYLEEKGLLEEDANVLNRSQAQGDAYTSE